MDDGQWTMDNGQDITLSAVYCPLSSYYLLLTTYS